MSSESNSTLTVTIKSAKPYVNDIGYRTYALNGTGYFSLTLDPINKSHFDVVEQLLTVAPELADVSKAPPRQSYYFEPRLTLQYSKTKDGKFTPLTIYRQKPNGKRHDLPDWATSIDDVNALANKYHMGIYALDAVLGEYRADWPNRETCELQLAHHAATVAKQSGFSNEGPSAKEFFGREKEGDQPVTTPVTTAPVWSGAAENFKGDRAIALFQHWKREYVNIMGSEDGLSAAQREALDGLEIAEAIEEVTAVVASEMLQEKLDELKAKKELDALPHPSPVSYKKIVADMISEAFLGFDAKQIGEFFVNATGGKKMEAALVEYGWDKTKEMVETAIKTELSKQAQEAPQNDVPATTTPETLTTPASNENLRSEEPLSELELKRAEIRKRYNKPQRGKDYLEVQGRVLLFRLDHPDWTIETEHTLITEKTAVYKAVIRNCEGRIISTGHGRATEESTKNLGGRYVEKAETAAIGRALSLAGYGTDDSLEDSDYLADSPKSA